MGWVADSVELAVALAEWAKKGLQSNAWKKKLERVSRELLLEDVDLHTAEETVKLAHQAGFEGPELDTVEERIAAIRKYERQHGKTARSAATRMRKKAARTKASKKAKTKKTKTTKKAPRKGKAPAKKRVRQ